MAANVLWDVRKRYRHHRRFERPDHFEVREDDVRVHEPSAEDVVLGRLVVEDLAAARRAGVVSERSLRLIVRTRIEGDPLEEVAKDEGVTKHAITQRRLRAERRLRAHAFAG